MPKPITDIIIKIPAKIRKIAQEHKLKRTEIEILSQLDYLNNQNGCTISNRTLSVYIDKSIPTVQRIIAKLIKLGLIVSDIIDHYQRTIKTTFEKVSKKLEEIKENIKDNLGQNDIPPYHNKTIYHNKKQFKSFNQNEIKGYQKIELKIYQQDHESTKDFEARCVESGNRPGVIVVRSYKLDKTPSNKTISTKEQLKNAFNKFKLSCQNV